jgi:two-component system, chemotaxis family, chemotaxis protein CheV
MSPVKKKELFSEGSIVRILTFDLLLAQGTKLTLGLNIQKIKEILDYREANIQALTKNYYPLVGLINLRQSSIPLLDINHFLHQDPVFTNGVVPGKRIIICEFQKLLLGIVVEDTHKIRQFNNSKILPVPEVLETFPGNIFNGILEDEGKFIKLLDIEFILTKLNVDVAPETKPPGTYSLQGKKVLIVEDSRLFRTKLIKSFEAKGAKLFVAEDGEEGLQHMQLHGHEIDLIFTDIEMPKLNGIGMVRKLRMNDHWKRIPVIFNTSISNPGLIEDITNEGLGSYIVKFDEAEIEKALAKCFG